MAPLYTRLSDQWRLSRSALVRLTRGGPWAERLEPDERKNLSWYWFDGFFASASDNIYLTNLVVYLLALGVTQAQVGLMSALASLMAAVMLLPGAALVERIGRRKELVAGIGGFAARLMVLVLAGLPFFLQGNALVITAIGLAVLRDAWSNLAFPAYMSLVGDLVPMEGRGRYFAARNFAMGAAGMAATLLAGLALTRAVQPGGYQAALLLAFLIGSGATYSFWRIKDPHPEPAQVAATERISLKQALRDLRAQPGFSAYLATAALWNLSLNIAGPFFTTYMVQNLHASDAMIGLTAVVSTLATLLVQRKAGELNDRWGSRKLQMVAGLVIPFVPMLWVLVTAAWHVLPLNIISGALWGVFSLASFNYLLQLTPPEKRARYSAIFQLTVTLSFAVGAALGSLIITWVGYAGVFIASGVGRLAAAVLFARFSRAEMPAVVQMAE